ncbi:MAG: hypothetical protein GY804_01510 [Alphaproteobacteria bacterium]|nr:hypothetical protein [Alphaproteobacteria bacterium]
MTIVLYIFFGISDSNLIAPEIGKGGILKDLIEEMPVPANGLQLARVLTEDAQELKSKLSSSMDTTQFHIVEEKVLDWQYPIHILSTKDVAEAKGNKFRNIRNSCNQVTKLHGMHVFECGYEHASEAVEQFINNWKESFSKEEITAEEWMESFMFVRDLIENNDHDLETVVIGDRDKNIASIEIFEKPIMPNQAANMLTSLAVYGKKGLSELSHRLVCKSLYQSGIEKVNIGGSETASLDFHKRKFNPIESRHLSTIEVFKLR